MDSMAHFDLEKAVPGASFVSYVSSFGFRVWILWIGA